MRNKLVATAIAGLVATPAVSQAAPEVNWFGFNQITANTGGANANGDGGGLSFGADRIRIGYKAKFDSGAHSKLQVDFNRPQFIRDGSQLPRVIKDATVGYDFGMVDVQAGMRKTPIGMDFNTSGKKLDIVKRGMEKDYVLERTAGAFVFGDAGPIGYAVFMGNPATRSGSVSGFKDSEDNAGVVTGEDYSYGGRLSYGMGKMLHAEFSYGISTATGSNQGVDTNDDGTNDAVRDSAEDYNVWDIGLKSQPAPGLTLKAEYLQGSNVGHVDGRDQTVWYLHGGYEITPMVEGVVRHYNSTAENDDNLDHTVSETWIGANFFLNPEKHHEARIQVFYAMANGDTEASDYDGTDPGNFHRIKGAQYDKEDEEYGGAFWAMLQTSF